MANRLAPCRHSEILYPSHPLKPEPTVECTAVAFAADSQSERDYRARLPRFRPSHPLPFSLAFSFWWVRTLWVRELQIKYVAALLVTLGMPKWVNASGESSRKRSLCARVSRRRAFRRIITVSSREPQVFEISQKPKHLRNSELSPEDSTRICHTVDKVETLRRGGR